MKNFRYLAPGALVSMLLSVALLTGCVDAAPTKNKFTIAGAPAPEINTRFGWLNTDRPYSISDFRGKIVLLDFWTLGCVNCQHIMPDLERLQNKFKNVLVVVGVHSAKFKSEKETQRIQDAIAKFRIDHPVVNDADYSVWKAYGVEAWPTLVLVSPDGKIASRHEGENVYDALASQIENLARQYEGEMNAEPLSIRLKNENRSKSALKFPSKLIADKGGDIWISDYGNNRIVKIDQSGKILDVIGKGLQGFDDGDFRNASFNGPQGLALKNNELFIADSKNNSIRVADLATRNVKTVAGNGKMGYYFKDKNWDVPVLPNTPWDLLIDGDDMYIADAGNHQILRMSLNDQKVFRFAGSGSEGIQDGNVRSASFSQPSGLTKKEGFIYVADPEASAIREINLKTKSVRTIIGKGLFQFGDVDGKTNNALLEHCVGLAERHGDLFLADTYNGKIKVLKNNTATVSTIASGLNEPNDILPLGNVLWVTDTNNSQIVKINLINGTKEIVKVR